MKETTTKFIFKIKYCVWVKPNVNLNVKCFHSIFILIPFMRSNPIDVLWLTTFICCCCYVIAFCIVSRLRLFFYWSQHGSTASTLISIEQLMDVPVMILSLLLSFQLCSFSACYLLLSRVPSYCCAVAITSSVGWPLLWHVYVVAGLIVGGQFREILSNDLTVCSRTIDNRMIRTERCLSTLHSYALHSTWF